MIYWSLGDHEGDLVWWWKWSKTMIINDDANKKNDGGNKKFHHNDQSKWKKIMTMVKLIMTTDWLNFILQFIYTTFDFYVL